MEASVVPQPKAASGVPPGGVRGQGQWGAQGGAQGGAPQGANGVPPRRCSSWCPGPMGSPSRRAPQVPRANGALLKVAPSSPAPGPAPGAQDNGELLKAVPGAPGQWGAPQGGALRRRPQAASGALHRAAPRRCPRKWGAPQGGAHEPQDNGELHKVLPQGGARGPDVLHKVVLADSMPVESK